MSLFDSLLAQVAETDREVFKKYPEFAEKVNKADEYVGKWEKWKADNWDDSAGMTKQAAQALVEKDNEIEALRLLQGNDMTWEDMKGNVDSHMNSRGFVDRKTLEQEIVPKLKFAKPEDLEAVDKKIQQLALGMDVAYTASVDLPVQYFKEFGSVADAPNFKMKDLFAHMTEKKIPNIEMAYESFVQPLRAKKIEAEAAVKEAKIREDERNKVKQEYQTQGIQPVDNSGSAPEMSALTMKINARRKTEGDAPKLTPGELGSGAATQDAYQQFLKDQAAGVKPKLPGYLNIN